MFLFTSLCEHVGKGHMVSPLGLPCEHGLGDTERLWFPQPCPRVSSPGDLWSACIFVPPPPQLLFYKFPNKGDFSSNTENLVFPQEYT